MYFVKYLGVFHKVGSNKEFKHDVLRQTGKLPLNLFTFPVILKTLQHQKEYSSFHYTNTKCKL